MELLFLISIILFFGIFLSYVLRLFQLPEVIGYIIAGFIIGPSILGVLSNNDINNLDILNTIALSLISFLVGSEFKFSYVKKLGSRPFIISLVCSIFTMFIVTLCLYLSGSSISFSLVMGAIASATAPAAIILIIKQYKAKGELTDTVLSVIAIEDIVSVLIFGFTIVIAKYLDCGETSVDSIMTPFIEIGVSLFLGIVFGMFLSISSKILKTKGNILSVVLIIIFLSILISNYAGMSSILICMITGTVFINLNNRNKSDKVLEMVDFITSPFIIIFFVLSGASFDFKVLPVVGLSVSVFILARTFGKVVGTYLGVKLSKGSTKLKKYLGFSLLSQTGIAIGLALVAAEAFKEESASLIAVTIVTSVIFDIIGTISTKISLKKAKEIR